MATMPGMNGDVYFGDPNEDKLPNWREFVDPDEDSDAPDPVLTKEQSIRICGFDWNKHHGIPDDDGDDEGGPDAPTDSRDSPESDESASR